MIVPVPFGAYVDTTGGIRCQVSSWRRIDDNVAPARSKATGIYINSALAKTEAFLNGFDEAILMTQDGHVCEGSAENLFILRRGQLITPPASENIVEGITRSVLMTFARDELGVEVVERTIDRSELYVADEVLLCGTGAEVSAVIEIDQRTIGSGSAGRADPQAPGPLLRRLQGRERPLRELADPDHLTTDPRSLVEVEDDLRRWWDATGRRARSPRRSRAARARSAGPSRRCR